MVQEHRGAVAVNDDGAGPDAEEIGDGGILVDAVGLGFAVRTVAPPPLPTGEYRWDGVGGTFFFIDPDDDLFAICMMQSPSQRQRIQNELKALIYQALRK